MPWEYQLKCDTCSYVAYDWAAADKHEAENAPGADGEVHFVQQIQVDAETGKEL